MGMFDYINYEMDCPYCNQKVDGFQSKDSDCELNKLEYWQVNNFYSTCKKCGSWIEFYLPIQEKVFIPIEKYKMIVSPACPNCRCVMQQIDPLKWEKYDDPEWECTSLRCNPKEVMEE